MEGEGVRLKSEEKKRPSDWCQKNIGFVILVNLILFLQKVTISVKSSRMPPRITMFFAEMVTNKSMLS